MSLPRLQGFFENNYQDRVDDNIPKESIHLQDADYEDLEYIDPSIDLDDLEGATDDLKGAKEVLDDQTKAKAYWTYEVTIVLINKYKAHYPLFIDAIHKNVEVKTNFTISNIRFGPIIALYFRFGI